MNHFRKQERLKGDRTRLYLMRAIRQEGFKATGVMDFNDGPRRYSDITRVLRRARELVLQDEKRATPILAQAIIKWNHFNNTDDRPPGPR
jgi:hypothetical protein